MNITYFVAEYDGQTLSSVHKVDTEQEAIDTYQTLTAQGARCEIYEGHPVKMLIKLEK